MKIIVRTPNWIGDGVMSIPALSTIRSYFPNDELHLVCKEYLNDLFLYQEGFTRIVPIQGTLSPAGLWKSALRLKREKYDLGILFTNSFHSALLFRLAGIRETAGYARDGRSFLLTHPIPVPSNGGHHRDYYLNLLRFRVPENQFDRRPPAIPLTTEEKAKVGGIWARLGIDPDREKIALAPTAAYGTAKCWLPDRFSRLIVRLQGTYPGKEIVLFGSGKEREKISALIPKSGKSFHNLAGQLSLREVILLLSSVQLLIANDSGLLHVAAALGIPLVAIFGPTIPSKTAPLSDKQCLLFRPSRCSPCTYRECPYPGHPCMEGISVDEVFSGCTEMLSRFGAKESK